MVKVWGKSADPNLSPLPGYLRQWLLIWLLVILRKNGWSNSTVQIRECPHFLHFRKDTTSVPRIIWGTIWGSFPVLGSFAVQFGDHLRYGDHLRAGIIFGPVPPRGGTPLFGLYGDVPLDRIWFFGLAVPNRVAIWLASTLTMVRTCPKQGMVLRAKRLQLRMRA